MKKFNNQKWIDPRRKESRKEGTGNPCFSLQSTRWTPIKGMEENSIRLGQAKNRTIQKYLETSSAYWCNFGFKPFWLKIWLKTAIAASAWSARFVCVQGKTLFNATQGMERNRHTDRLVRGHPWSSPAFSTVPEGERQGEVGRRCQCQIAVRSRERSSSWPTDERPSGCSSEFIEGSQFGSGSCCVGSEDSSAKTEVAVGTAHVRFDADAKVAVAHARASRLQTAIAVLGPSRVPRWMR